MATAPTGSTISPSATEALPSAADQGVKAPQTVNGESTTAPPAAGKATEDSVDKSHIVNGEWVSLRAENFENFLKVMQVPWAVRKIAKHFKTSRKITLKGSRLEDLETNVFTEQLNVMFLDREFELKDWRGEKMVGTAAWEGDGVAVTVKHQRGFTINSLVFREGELLVQRMRIGTVVHTRWYSRKK